jgi:FKBP-type peptidyl-prolyl cis-trans isomerase FklB
MDKVSYALGMSIAHNMLQSGVKDLTFDDFIAGVKATLQGEQPAVPYEEAGKILDAYFTDLEAAKAAEEAEIGEAMKKDGEAFLAENAAKPGVITLASGLQYKVIKAGTGRKPRRSDRVRCHYEGTFTNGMVFDSSYKRGEPAVFGVGQVIAGWTEALQLMSEGSQWELYIPYNLAYGEAGAHGAIPPYAALVFKVELLEVL